MCNVVAMWQTLVPGDLPTKHLQVVFRDFSLQPNLASFDFAGFVHLNPITMADAYADGGPGFEYQNPLCAEKVLAGHNHYGPVFSIHIGANVLRFEEYSHAEGVCQATSMRLLKHLMINLNLECQWEAYSWYYDNHETSATRQGTQQEIRALFNARGYSSE